MKCGELGRSEMESGETEYGEMSRSEMEYGETSHSEKVHGEMGCSAMKHSQMEHGEIECGAKSRGEMECEDDLRYRAGYDRGSAGLRDSIGYCDHRSPTDPVRGCRERDGNHPLDLTFSKRLEWRWVLGFG